MNWRQTPEGKAWQREYEKKKRAAQPEYFLWKSAKKRARDKGLAFDIEPSDIIIPNFCPYLGIEIIHETGHKARRDNSPSLDRIDSTNGYVKGNIIVCSWRANFLKSDATLNELLLITKQWSQQSLNAQPIH
jgi:hypothetical protein